MSESASLLRRFAWPWRIAFILYAAALTTGTHWPNLKLAPEPVLNDKTIHILAFGGLVYLLWRTRWLSPRLLVVAIVLAWSALDEISQAIPSLNRTVAWDDAVANTLGIITAAAWLWALKPVGGPVNRLRLVLHRFAFDRLFRWWRVWGLFIGIFLACATPILVIGSLFSSAPLPPLIMLSVAAWLLASIVPLFRLWRSECRLVARTRPCFACGASCAGLTFDRTGRATCPVCSAEVHYAQWTDPAPPAPGTLLGILSRPALLTVIVILFIFALISVGAHVFDWSIIAQPASGLAPRIARFFGTLSPQLTEAIDLTVCLLLLALATRLYRTRLARYYDRSVRCRRCGHDLRGTPTERGVGRCGECGTPFVRITPLPQSEEQNRQTTEGTEDTEGG
jgi:hypothetical protein